MFVMTTAYAEKIFEKYNLPAEAKEDIAILLAIQTYEAAADFNKLKLMAEKCVEQLIRDKYIEET